MSLLIDRDIRAVVFDMDGTLLDSTASVERCWDRLAAAMGIARVSAKFQHGIPSVASIRATLPEASESEVQEWNRVHLRLETEDAGGSAPIAGVFELLRALDAAETPWGIATGCQRELGHARHAAAGLPLPEVFICAEDYSAGKPAPDPFLRAAEALGFSASQTLVVEDAPAGVAGGIAAGALVVAVVETHTREELNDAHFIVDSLDELRLLLLGA